MEASFTESTLLDLVSEDGRSGFMVRLARHVDEGKAWVWAIAFGPNGFHGFTDDRMPCPSDRTPDDGQSAVYDVALPATRGRVARMHRNGPADAVTDGSCLIEVYGHATDAVPRGPGAARMRIEAKFRCRAARAGSNLPGRTESIVEVEAVVLAGGVARELRGYGQFHEQRQEAPRFDTPFTYTSLRGRDISLVGLQVPKAGRAVVGRQGVLDAYLGFTIDPLDTAASLAPRHLSIAPCEGHDGEPILTGTVTPTVTYSVPINGGTRPSAIVIGELDGERVSGFVNDWTP